MTEVYASEFKEAQAAVDRTIKCPDVAAIAMVLIWLYWSRKPNIAITYHIRYGIRQALWGRDLPGVQDSKFRDIWDKAANWGGAGMGELADPSPGPDKLVEDAEAYQVLRGILTDKEAKANDLYIAGLKNMEVAEELEVTQGRATQLRTQTAAKWKRLCE